LNCNELFQSHGVLESRQLEIILPQGEYPPEQHYFIIEMMKKNLNYALNLKDLRNDVTW
jgi:hypothetical protein